MIKKISIILSIAVIAAVFPSISESAATKAKPSSETKIVSTNSICSVQKSLVKTPIQSSLNGTKYYLKLVPPPNIIDDIGVTAPSIKDPIAVGLKQVIKEIGYVPSK